MCSLRFLLIAVGICGLVVGQELPEELRRIERERTGWKAGRVEWVQVKSRIGAVPRHFKSTFTKDESLTSFLGDDEGVVARDKEGHVQQDGMGPLHSLVTPDHWWTHAETAISADMTDRSEKTAVAEFRALGLTPHFAHEPLAQVLRRPEGQTRYSETRIEGRKVIEAKTEDASTRWEFDSQSELPARVSLEKGGRIVVEARINLAKFGDVWFPEQIEFFQADYADGAEPTEVLQILNVEVNPKDVPEHLGPSDIGIDSCCNITHRDKDLKHVPEMLKFDGERAIALEEWGARADAGELKPGPKFLANLERADALHALRASAKSRATSTSLFPSETRSEWEIWVRNFVVRYKLDSDQIQKATQALEAAEAQAEQVLSRSRQKFESIDAELREIEKLEMPARAAKAVEWNNKRKELLQPLEEIFKARLEPAVRKLPTRAQRAAVEKPATSKPASAPAP